MNGPNNKNVFSKPCLRALHGRCAAIFITLQIVVLSVPGAAFAALLNAGDPFGADQRNSINKQVAGDPNPLTGALSYEYPLVVPPGRGSLTPDLKLQYSSQSHDLDSALGIGWDINIPYIERVNRKGTDKLYKLNVFYSSFDGEIGSTSAATSSSTFGAKFENGSFNKYTFTNNSWRMTDKQGTVYTFGSGTSTRMDNPSATTTIYKWMLEEVRDTNNNYIKYQYAKDAGQIYPSHIIYTGATSTDGPFDVAFTLENRPDIATSSRTQFTVVTNKRISEIQAKISGTMVRRYALAYTTADNGRNSVLQSITEAGQDEAANQITLPATTFSYQKSIKTYTASTTWNAPIYFIRNGIDGGNRSVDINGDGLPDLFAAAFFGTGATASSSYINNGAGWTVDSTWKPPSIDIISSGHELGVRFVDVNGDGRTDIMEGDGATGSISTTTWVNNGLGWTASSTWNTPVYFKVGTPADNDNGVRIVDVNGDGLPDLMQSTDTSVQSYINNGAGWTTDSAWNISGVTFVATNTDSGARLADVNGDGLPDVIKMTKTGINLDQKVYLNTGYGWSLATDYVFPAITFNVGNTDTGTRVEDINGDTLPDLVFADAASGTPSIYINNGHGWTLDTAWQVPYNWVNGATDLGVRYMDLDGNGVPDPVRSYQSDLGAVTVESKLSDSKPADRLVFVHTSKGANLAFTYKGSNQYRDPATGKNLNPFLPLSYSTLSEKSVWDGIAASTTMTYVYGDGRYYFGGSFDRRYVGFATTTITDALGNVTKMYYHQGNGTESTLGEYADSIGKFGKMYREEIYSAASTLFAESINKWNVVDLGLGRSFVNLIQKIKATFDGNASHKDSADTYSYDAYGNLQQQISYGEVTASENGTFSDVGSDRASTTISYAASTTPYIVGLPSQKTTVNQSLTKISELRYCYDNLSLGSVDKGNNTKIEKWATSTTYVNTQKLFNVYGLVTRDTDERGKQTNYVYDSFMLYVATATNPLGQSTNAYYDYSLGRPKQIIDANNLRTQTDYDALDRTLNEKQPDLSSPSTLVTRTSYVYTDTSMPTSVQQTDYLSTATSTNTYTYSDGLGRVVQKRQQAEESPMYSVSDKIYDQLGQLAKESLPYFSSGTTYTATTSNFNLYTTNIYDVLKRVTQTGTVVGTTTNTYDNWIATTTDAIGNAKVLYKDALGNLIRVDEINGTSTYSTNYTYDRANNLTKITDANANVRNFTYDGLGNELTAQDLHAAADANFGTWTYTYDNACNQVTRRDAKNQTVNFAYPVSTPPVPV
jgi:YD repeat-containing protein